MFNTPNPKSRSIILLLLSAIPLHAEPLLSSWLTDISSKYARIYTNDANKLAGNSVTTWTNGIHTQKLPVYSGVQQVSYSADWVYIRTSGLGGHVMGPWLNGEFPGLPVNQKATYRFPRKPGAVPATKTATGLGEIGYFVDGVAMYDGRDGFGWNGAREVGMGQVYWNRDAYVNEGYTFDPANAHQGPTAAYHYHANPVAVRYLLGDHVDYNTTTKSYSESTSPVTAHSPILGWVRDGYPIYGPYGYSSAMDPASGLTRMRSGYVLRDGATSGVDDVRVTGRTLPAWALRQYGAQTQTGPSDFTTYPLGRYMEDKAYRGDIAGQSMGAAGTFDLDEYNGRFCVTPEFPGGTYAYFVTIEADGTPVYPYTIGRAFYGNPTGSPTTLTGSETTLIKAGPDTPEDPKIVSVDASAQTITMSWSSTEGGTYTVQAASIPASTWKTLTTTATATPGAVDTELVETGAVPPRQYWVTRTALALYDDWTTYGSAGWQNLGNLYGWAYHAGSGWYWSSSLGWFYLATDQQYSWNLNLNAWLWSGPGYQQFYSLAYGGWMTPSTNGWYYTTTLGWIATGQYDGWAWTSRLGWFRAWGDGHYFWTATHGWVYADGNGYLWAISGKRL